MTIDRTAPLPARRWQRLFAAVAALGLVVPTPGWHYSSLAAEETDAELAPTCAAVYSALSANAADKNMQAMIHNYYIYSDLSPERAGEKSAEAAVKIYGAMASGKFTEHTVMDVAKGCSARFSIPLPLSISPYQFPSYATFSSSTAPASRPAPAPVQVESAEDRACAAASKSYTDALHKIPAQLDGVGSPGNEDGSTNSKYYYAVGRICEGLKVAEDQVGRTCGWSARPKKLDMC